MNLLRVQYFLTFCETLHFTNAARALGISQPALTKAINQLEADVGTRLIRREGKHTHLTKHGEATKAKFQQLMQHVNGVESDIKAIIKGEEEVLRLAVTRSIDFKKIADFLVQFYQQKPNAQFDIVDCHLKECEDLLLSGEVDCVLTIECDEIRNRFFCIELYEEVLGVAITEKNGETYASSQPNTENTVSASESVDLVSNVFDASSNTANSLVRCTQQLWVQQLVKAGIGISFSAQSSDTVTGIHVLANNPYCHIRQVYAAIPVGRNDSDLFGRFVHFLKNYCWQ